MGARWFLAVVLAALVAVPGVATASREIPGTFLRLSLVPDDPFFLPGEVVQLYVDVNPVTTVSGNVGLGVALPPEQSTGCPGGASDRVLVFFAVGTGGGVQCLSSWVANPSSRITQFKGLSAAAGSHLHQLALQRIAGPPLPVGAFIVFIYVLDASNPAIVIDSASTTVDLE